jgi:hypothetical protein
MNVFFAIIDYLNGGYGSFVFSTRGKFLSVCARVFSYQMFFIFENNKNRFIKIASLQLRISLDTFADEDDLKEVIVVEFQVFFREMKVFLNIHPLLDTPHRRCCRKKPN